VDSRRSRKWNSGLGNRISPYRRCGKAFLLPSWLFWICSQARAQVGKLSNSLDTEFCLEGIGRIALTGGGKPQMFSTRIRGVSCKHSGDFRAKASSTEEIKYQLVW